MKYSAGRVKLFAMASLAVAMLALPATSRAQNLKCFILTPPEQLLEGVKQVAIIDFALSTSFQADEAPGKEKKGLLGALERVAESGKNQPQRFPDGATKLTDMIIAHLLQDKRGVGEVGSGLFGLGSKEGKSFQNGARTNVFGVVERAKLQAVMNEQQLGQSGAISEAQAAQVGKLLGVDAIITGGLSIYAEDRWLKEEREDKNKNKYQVDCNKRVANVSATIRVIKIETGQVIGSKQSNHKVDKKKCPGSFSGDLPTPEAQVEECLQAVTADLVDYFAPHFEEQKFDFARLEGDDFKRFHETAKNALERYDIDAAYLQYAAVAEQDPYNHAAQFNLGVMYDVVGDYKHALEKFAMAAKLKSKEDKYTKAQTRVSKQLAFWEKLNALGISIQERKFEVSSEQVQAASIPKIQVAGSSSDRVEIKAQPDAGSPTLVRVPGEIELDLVEASGDWFKVKLLDGREGFIAKRNAKMLK